MRPNFKTEQLAGIAKKSCGARPLSPHEQRIRATMSRRLPSDVDRRRDEGGSSESDDSDPDSPPSALARSTTGWLEDSAAPPRRLDRTRSTDSSNGGPSDSKTAKEIDDGSLRERVDFGRAVSPERQSLEEPASGSSPTFGLRLDAPATTPSPKREKDTQGDAGSLTLDVDAPKSAGAGQPGPSPHAPGAMDELTRFGSSVDIGAFDMFASTGSGSVTAPPPPRRTRFNLTSAPDPDGGDGDMFETIVRGSSKRGLPFGMTTPLAAGMSGGDIKSPPGKAGRNVKRFENTFVPVAFPGRRTGRGEGEDIGSSDEEEAPSTILGRIFRGRKGNKPSTIDDSPQVKIGDPSGQGFKDSQARSAPNQTGKILSFWRTKVPVTSWHIGTSTALSSAALMALRWLLFLLCLLSLAYVFVMGSKGSGLGIAYATTAAPYAHVGFLMFLAAAAVSSSIHTWRPTRDQSEKPVYRIAAATFQAVLLLTVVEFISFIVISAVPGLQPTALGGADDVFSFTSVYAQEEYLLAGTVTAEFFLNNVPFQARNSLISLAITVVLVCTRIALAPQTAVIAVGATTIAAAAVLGLLLPYIRKFMDSKPDFDRDLAAEFGGQKRDPLDFGDSEDEGGNVPRSRHSAHIELTGSNKV